MDDASNYPASSADMEYMSRYIEFLGRELVESSSTGSVLFEENMLELELELNSAGMQNGLGSILIPRILFDLPETSDPPAVTTPDLTFEEIQAGHRIIREEEAPFIEPDLPVLCVDPKLLITPSRSTIPLPTGPAGPVEPAEPDFNSSDDGSADSDTEIGDDNELVQIVPSPATTLGNLTPALPQYKKLEALTYPGSARTERPRTLSPHYSPYSPYVRQSGKTISPLARFHPSPTSSTNTSPAISSICPLTTDSVPPTRSTNILGGLPEGGVRHSGNVPTPLSIPHTTKGRTVAFKKRARADGSDTEDDLSATAPISKRARNSPYNAERDLDYAPDDDSDSDGGSKHDASYKKRKITTNFAASSGRSSRSKHEFSCDAEVWKWVRGGNLKACRKQGVTLESVRINGKLHFLRFAVCGKTFGRAAELERHTLDHITISEDRTIHVPGHTCGVCGEKQFTFRTDNLERHQKSEGCRAHLSKLSAAQRSKYVVASMSDDRKRALRNGMEDMDGDEIAFNASSSRRRS